MRFVTPTSLIRGLAAALLLCLFTPTLSAQSLDATTFDPQTAEPVPAGFEAMPADLPVPDRGGDELEPTQYLPSGSSKSVRSLGDDTFIFQDGGSLVTATTADGGTTLDRYILPAQPSDMLVEDDLIYVPLRKDQGLMVLDASDPADLALVGHLAGRDLLSIAIDGDYAYAGLGLSGLVVYDVSDPADITELSMQSSDGSSNGTYVDGSTLYVAAGTSGLRIFDLSDPAVPAPLASFGTDDTFATYVVVRDDVAYLAGGFGLIAVDVSDPENPDEIGRFGTAGETTYEVALGEDTAYLPGLDGFRVLDISDLEAITQHAIVPASQALSVHFDGAETAFFAERYAGVYALDVSDPAEPAEIASTQNAGFTHNLFFDGNMLYVTDLAGSLRIIDTSGEEAVEIGRIAVPGNTQGVTVEDDYAYVTDADFGGTGFTVVDVSDPADPEIVGSYHKGNQAFGLDVAGTTAYVAFGFSGLVALDVSDPTEPTLLGSYAFGANASDVSVRDDIAYVTSSGAGMLTIDVSDPADMQQLDAEADWGFLNAIDLAAEDFDWTTAYVADGEQGLRIVDISDPADLVSLDTNPTLSQARDVAATVGLFGDITGQVVYIADDFFGIRYYEILGDDAVEMASFESADRGIGVATSDEIAEPGSLVALATGETGVYLFEAPFSVANEGEASAETFALESAYPNPFATTTTVRYTLPASAEVTLAVYDVLGRRVATLEEGTRVAGSHEATFDAADLPSGVYLTRLTVGERSETRKLLVVR